MFSFGQGSESQGGEAAPPAIDENGQPIPAAEGAAAPAQLGEDGQPIPAAEAAPEPVPEPEVIIVAQLFVDACFGYRKLAHERKALGDVMRLDFLYKLATEAERSTAAIRIQT